MFSGPTRALAGLAETGPLDTSDGLRLGADYRCERSTLACTNSLEVVFSKQEDRQSAVSHNHMGVSLCVVRDLCVGEDQQVGGLC